MNNDVLYLEADEEITAAIDRLTKMPGENVKIVVPKRSTLLQSVVNLKLLKKAADDAGKKLVLVTGDRTSTHLAGRVGLPVAATLTSKAEVIEAKQPLSQSSDEIEAEDETSASSESSDSSSEPSGVSREGEESDAEVSVTQNSKLTTHNSLNKPSYAKPMMVKTPVGDPGDTHNSKLTTPSAGSRVPDFNKMQKRLLWGGLAVVAIIALLVINYFITSASVTLFAQGSKIAASFTATVDPEVKTTDVQKAVLAADNLTSSHDLTATANATGKQDIGTKAGGSVTIKNCEDTSAHPLSAGAVMTSQGKSFVTTAPATIPAGTFSNGGKVCSTAQSVNVAVVASENGDIYNLAPASYSSPSLTSNFILQGSQMSGGTSKTVNVITQADVDKAVADLLAKDKDSSQKDLENKASSDSQAIKESFTASQGAVTANPAVGAQADQTVVNVKVNYAELAVAQKDLKEVLRAQEISQVGSGNQIYDDGLGSLSITPIKVTPGAASTFTFATTAFGGAKLDAVAIAKQLAGKRYGDAADVAAKLPGVSRAEIKLSPPWASKLPRMASHIKVEVKVASNN